MLRVDDIILHSYQPCGPSINGFLFWDKGHSDKMDVVSIGTFFRLIASPPNISLDSVCVCVCVCEVKSWIWMYFALLSVAKLCFTSLM